MTTPEIYLDHAASAPMFDEVIAAMADVQASSVGNPSGAHRWARAGLRLVDESREMLASLLGCRPDEIVFTSGGTESDNLALGATRSANSTAPPEGSGSTESSDGGALLISAIEHPAVREPGAVRGASLIPVLPSGLIDMTALAALLVDGVDMVSIMTANNEVGSIQPIEAIAALIAELRPSAIFHTDAVQAFRWIDPSTWMPYCDLASLSAHKFGGPKGIGALVVKQGVSLQPMLLGGGQERERRSGTHNVAGIVGMAHAARLASERRSDDLARVEHLSARLIHGLSQAVPDVRFTGRGDLASPSSEHLASIVHVCVAGVESESLLFLLDAGGVFVSAASSCASGAQEPSAVLAAMGVDLSLATGSVRMSIGPELTEDEVDYTVGLIAESAARLRRFAT